MLPNREYWWSTKQPQVTDLCWQLGFQWHRRGIELVFKSLDCFTKRLFHTATFFCCYICICCLKLHQADYKVEEFFCFFFNLDLVGEHSAPMYLPVYYLRRILISRPPRVFRRFKRRSCCKTVCTTLLFTMMLSSNGSIICITGHLCTKASNAELWCFLSYVPE